MPILPSADACLRDALTSRRDMEFHPQAYEASVRWLQSDGHFLLTPADARYPERLRQLADAPRILFATGNIDLLGRDLVAVVGSRSCTPQGARDARAFARAFSRAGVGVVSGMASGIDAAAHEGALEEAGSTVAVMGTGPDVVYPRIHQSLHARISAGGCVITEFPPGTPPAGDNFPRRNRIISGLSLGVLVVEAAIGSGSLITARAAAKQGRDVFVVPGSIHSPQARGCHQLIREGAALVDRPDQVLEGLGYGQLAQSQARAGVQGLESASPDELRLLQAMAFGPASIDELARSTGFAAGHVIAQLMRLQITRWVEPLPGGRYLRVIE
jgi:DNA processing protein